MTFFQDIITRFANIFSRPSATMPTNTQPARQVASGFARNNDPERRLLTGRFS